MERMESARARLGILALIAFAASAFALALTCGPLANSAAATESITVTGSTFKCGNCGQEFSGQDRHSWYYHEQNTGHTISSKESGAKQVEGQYVYRMYNTITSEHLFTTDKSEYQSLTKHNWQQEGDAWVSPATSGKPVYRLYNAGLGALTKMSHHYTTDKAEADDLVANHGWVYDFGGQPAFYSAEDSSGIALGHAEQVARLYNPALSAHHFTVDMTEYALLIGGLGWSAESGFWAYATEEELNRIAQQ